MKAGLWKQTGVVAGTTMLVILGGMPTVISAAKPTDEERIRSVSEMAQLAMVDCQLPGQLRQLGGQLTYLTPRRAARITAIDCEIRGGEYVAADLAGGQVSLNVWLPRAKQGESEAQYHVGRIYEQGMGVPVDFQKAAYWYQEAGEQGVEAALQDLGFLYEKGLGVSQDSLKALNLYREASGLDEELDFAFNIQLAREEADARVAAMSEQLNALNDETQSLRVQLRRSNALLNERRQDFRQAELDIVELRAALAQEKQKPTSTVVDNKKVKQLQKDLRQREAQLKKQQTEITDLQNSLVAQRGELSSSLQAAQEQSLRLQEQLSEQEEATESLRAQLARREQQLIQSEEQVAALTNRYEADRADLLASRQAVDRRLEDSSGENVEAMRSVMAQLDAKTQELQQQQTTIDALKNSTHALVSAIRRLGAERDNQLSARNTEVLKLRGQLSQANQDITELTAKHGQDKTRLLAEQEALRVRQAETSGASTAEVQALTDALAAKSAALQEQQEKILAMEAKAEQWQAEIGDLGTARDEVLSQNNVEVQKLRTQLTEKEGQIANLTSLYQLSDAQWAAEKRGLLQRQQELSGLSASEIHALNAELRNKALELERQEDTLGLVERDADNLRAEVEKLRTDHAQQLAAETETSLDLRIQLAQARESLIKAEDELAKRQFQQDAQLLRLGHERRLLQEENTRVSNRQSNEIQALRTKLEQSEAELTKRQREIQVQRIKVANLEKTVLELASSDSPKPRRSPSIVDKARETINFGDYYALVIGNNDYQHLTPLQTAVNDARSIGFLLEHKYQYNVKVLTDATSLEMMKAIDEYRRRLTKEDNLLIYYAGHGQLQEERLRGYWLGVDAERESQATWLSVQEITNQIDQMLAKHVLVIADSCFSGALTRNSAAGMVPGETQTAHLRRIERWSKMKTRMVMTSGAQDPVMDSGGGGAHSVFAKSLIQILEQNKVILDGTSLYGEIFERVKRDAAQYDFEQRPQFDQIANVDHRNGEFLFVPYEDVRLAGL